MLDPPLATSAPGVPAYPWSHSLPAPGSAFPEDLVAALWSYFEWDARNDRAEWARPETPEQLRTLIHFAYQASLRSEEARGVRFQLVFDLAPSELTVPFDPPLEYSVAQLVKLSPAIGIGFRWLVVRPRRGGDARLEVAGVCDPILSPHATARSLLTRWAEGTGIHLPEVTGIQVAALGPAWLRVSTWAQRYFELRDCAIRYPFTIHEIPAVREWYAEVAAGLDARDVSLGAALVRRVWGSIVSKVRDARHGGCFIVVPQAPGTAALPVRFNYLAAGGSDRLGRAIGSRLGLEPALSRHVHGEADLPLAELDEGHFRERDVARAADLLASLAAVDGAVILGRDLRVLGFGAEILNPGQPQAGETVACASPGVETSDRPLSGFGMRHRSAYRLCQRVGESIAFVISQDGDLRVFCNRGGVVWLYEGPTPEDWVMMG